MRGALAKGDADPVLRRPSHMTTPGGTERIEAQFEGLGKLSRVGNLQAGPASGEIMHGASDHRARLTNDQLGCLLDARARRLPSLFHTTLPHCPTLRRRMLQLA